MKRIWTAMLIVAAMVIAGQAGANPPQQTLDLIEQAGAFFERLEAGRGYTVRSMTVIAKPNGQAREEQVRVSEMTVGADGEHEARTIQVIQDGVDVTDDEDTQASFGKPSDEEQASLDEDKGEGDGDGGDGIGFSLSLPTSETAGDYMWGETTVEGPFLVATFTPVDGKSKEELDKMASGRLAWDPDSGEPRWVEFGFARNPMFVKRMSTRMEFRRHGDELYPCRMTASGQGGVLLYQRTMDLVLEISDIR